MPNITPSEDRTVETVHVPNNPTLTGLARLTRNVAYRTGADDLVMDIIAPQSTGDDDDRRYPGNTSLLVGLTADDPRYEDGSYATESDAVSFVVSCFPPTDMMEAIDAFGNEDDPFRLYYFGPFAAVVGATHETGLSDDVRRRAADMSPYLQVRDGVAYPPTMLLHGTADTVVPYRQSVKMHKRLLEHGVDSRLVLVDGAEHERDFWSPQVFDMIFDFIRERC